MIRSGVEKRRLPAHPAAAGSHAADRFSDPSRTFIRYPGESVAGARLLELAERNRVSGGDTASDDPSAATVLSAQIGESHGNKNGNQRRTHCVGAGLSGGGGSPSRHG